MTTTIKHGDGRIETLDDVPPAPAKPRKITIPMSERRPLKIVDTDWPVIARADWHNGQYDFQANYVRKIVVREHDDGRRLVYGTYGRGSGGAPVEFRGAEGGFLVAPVEGRPDDDETIRAIRRVAGIIGDDQMADECIGDLPPEDETVVEDDSRTVILLRRMTGIAESGPTGIDPVQGKDLLACITELRQILGT